MSKQTALTKARQFLKAPLQQQTALEANDHAGACGLLAAELRMEVADKESGRKDFQIRIRDAIMEAEGVSKTEAENRARAHADYVAYCNELAEMRRHTEEADVLYQILMQRANLLLQVQS